MQRKISCKTIPDFSSPDLHYASERRREPKAWDGGYEDLRSAASIRPYHPEADIGIAQGAIPCHIGLLAAAIVPVRIPTAALDDIHAIGVC